MMGMYTLKKVFIIITSVLLVLMSALNVYFIIKSNIAPLNPISELKDFTNDLSEGVLGFIIFFYPILFIIIVVFDYIVILISLYLTVAFIITMILGIANKKRKMYNVLYFIVFGISCIELVFLTPGKGRKPIEIVGFIIFFLFILTSIIYGVIKLVKINKENNHQNV